MKSIDKKSRYRLCGTIGDDLKMHEENFDKIEDAVARKIHRITMDIQSKTR